MEANKLDLLTPSEKKTLRQLLVDHDQKAVARTLGLSPETVKTHLRNAREKCGYASSFALARALIAHERSTPFQGIPPKGGGPDGDVAGRFAPPDAKAPAVHHDDELREERTVFTFTDRCDHAPPARSESDKTIALKRLLLVGALVLILIVAIILAFPLSESFQRFANAIETPT